ncbi:PIN domain-containing protein [Polyangium aurulentum]|uniref:PIN domain-containing protein n=1 Tax=Polyangium aurulentum TaxID=2567896 RepID=UPI0010ADB665|nr:PIN domain-containing protein [Polyangium aurulentum]UQA63311.1 PIN domain-containing protein [Polyangium aurulentum]
MSTAIILDAGPLAMVTHRGGVPEIDACKRWLSGLLARGARVVIPEIADYETRRELLRASKTSSVARLDALATTVEFLPITTAAMRHAAQLWAEARQQGRPTADPKALDADVILAAQALTLDATAVIVATTNVAHLARFVQANAWREIR